MVDSEVAAPGGDLAAARILLEESMTRPAFEVRLA
jgi:hypothetical protein